MKVFFINDQGLLFWGIFQSPPRKLGIVHFDFSEKKQEEKCDEFSWRQIKNNNDMLNYLLIIVCQSHIMFKEHSNLSKIDDGQENHSV